ncbi:MAG: ATP-binding protein [Myxococcales bacterium]
MRPTEGCRVTDGARLRFFQKVLSKALVPPRLPSPWRYASALASVSLMALLQMALVPRPTIAPFVLAYLAVVLAAWLGGRGPGLGAVLLAGMAHNYLFVEPVNAFNLSGAARSATLLFFVAATAVAVLCGSLRDALEQAEESGERFRALGDNAPDLIARFDRDLRLRYVNPVASRFAGISAEQAFGKRCGELGLGSSFVSACEEAVRRVFETGETLSTELELEGGGPGQTALLEGQMAPERGRHGEALSVLALFRDVTERKELEAATWRREEQLRQATLAANLGLWSWIPGTSTLEVGANWRWLFGVLDRTVVTFETWREALHPEDRERAVAALHEAVESRREFNVEYRVVRQDGTLRWVADRGGAVYDESGRAVRMAGANVDITERKQADAERERLLEALREADQRKDVFLGVLSHELRGPLAPIRNSLHILHRGGLDERGRRAVSIIDRQSAQLSKLVDDLLDVTRIARGKIRLQRTRLDLAGLVRHTVDDYRSVAAAGGLRLELQVPSEPVWVDGDSARLAQIAGNLLQNAVKFTPAGGRVRAALARSDQGRAVLEISDTGMGIDAQTLPQLFEPFSQADRSLARSRGGLGLGLALTKGLVGLHGGDIQASSEGAGRGATFTIKLPLAGEPAQAAQHGPRASGGVRRRILVVEDNRDAADTLREVLELDGHRVVVAYDGPDGLEKAHAFRPHLVLCDIGLPGLDGYGVARELRRDTTLASVFLIALTGYAQPEDQRRAREAGFDRHLAKPPDFDAIGQLISECCID